MRKIFLFTTVIWPFLFSYIDLATQTRTNYNLSILYFIPQEIRYIEILLYGILIILALYKGLLNVKSNFEVYLLFFFGIVIINGLVFTLTQQLNYIYIYIAIYQFLIPFLVLYIGKQIHFKGSDIIFIEKFLLTVFFLNIIALFLQFYLYDYTIVFDAFTGLFVDSHTQAIFMFCMSLYFFVKYLKLKKKLDFLLFFIGLLSGMTGVNEKAMGMYLFVIIGYWILKTQNIYIKFSLTFLFALILNYIEEIIEFAIPRAKIFFDLENYKYILNDLGLFRGLTLFYSTFSDNLIKFITGNGPGNFGSPSALRSIRDGHSTQFLSSNFYAEAFDERWFTYFSMQGIASKSNVPSVVLGEYGIIVFILFVLILVKFYNMISGLRNEIERHALKIIFIFLMLNCLFAYHTVWGTLVSILPLFSYTIIKLKTGVIK